MAWIGRTLLCLVTVCWCACESLATNPGLKVRLSQAGLNYAARIAVEKVSPRVQGAKLPDHEGKRKVALIGVIPYGVTNMKVSRGAPWKFS